MNYFSSVSIHFRDVTCYVADVEIGLICCKAEKKLYARKTFYHS